MGNFHRIVCKELFTWREEDPRSRNNFSLGFGAKISVRVMPKKTRFEKELKMAGEKTENAIWGIPVLFTGVNKYLSAELSQ